MADPELSTLDDLLSGGIPDETVDLGGPVQPTKAYADLPEKLAFVGGLAGAQPGRIAGAVLGTPAGGPIGTVAGSQAGAGVGAAIGATGGYFLGQSFQDLANDVPVSLDRIAQNLTEAAKSGLIQGSAEMALPAAGQIITGLGGKKVIEKGVGWMAGKMGQYILPQHGSVVQMTEKAAQKGGSTLTAGQMIEPGSEESHRMLKLFENLSYNAWFGGPLKKTYQTNEAAIQSAFDQFVAQMEKLAPKDAEATFRGVIDGRVMDYMMRPAKTMFDDIRKRAPGGQVELTPMFKQLRDPNSALGNLVVNNLTKIRDSMPDPAGVQAIDKVISLLQTPKGAQVGFAMPRLTLDQAIHLKTELNNIAKRPSLGGSPEGQVLIGAAERMSKQIDDKVMEALKRQQTLSSDTTLVRDYERAQKFYAAATEKYRNEFVKKTLDTIEKKPGSLARLLMPNNIASESEHLNLVRSIKAAYGPRWNLEMRPLLVSSLGRRAFDEVNQTFSPRKLVGELDKYGTTLLDEMLGKNSAKEMVDFAKVMEHAGTRPKGQGSVAIQLLSAGAAAGVAGGAGYALTGDFEKAAGSAGGGAATILLGPRLLGEILGNPRWLKAMKEGVFQMQRTGKPPAFLSSMLRQASALAAKPSLEESLAIEPDLPKKLATFGQFARGTEPTLQSESRPGTAPRAE